MARKKTKALVFDDRTCTVVCSSGTRYGPMRLAEAHDKARAIEAEWLEVGTPHRAVIYYRDGSRVARGE